jgi:hypothetical protein
MTTSTRCIIVVLACIAAVTCVIGQAKEAHVESGFVASGEGVAYLYTTDGHLNAMVPIRLQYPTLEGAAQCCLRLRGDALEAPSRSISPVTDALFGNPVFRYRLKQFPDELRDAPFIGAAVIGASTVSADPVSGGTILRIGTASAGGTSRVKTCLGSEGSQLFLIADGRLASQLYYAFGYDVTATCDPAAFDLPIAR